MTKVGQKRISVEYPTQQIQEATESKQPSSILSQQQTDTIFEKHPSTKKELPQHHQAKTTTENRESRQFLRNALLQANFTKSQVVFSQLPTATKQDPQAMIDWVSKHGSKLHPDEMIECCNIHAENKDVILALLDGLLRNANCSPIVALETISPTLGFDLEVQEKAMQVGAQKLSLAWQEKLTDGLQQEKAMLPSSFISRKGEGYQARKSRTDSTRKALASLADGSFFHGITGGSKDGLVTESEVISALLTIAEKEPKEMLDIVQFIALYDGYQYMQTKGKHIRLQQSSNGTNTETETTQKRSFAQGRLDSLEQFLQQKLAEHEHQHAEKKIQRANETHDHHKAIPDVLEKAIYGYTTKDYKEINQALRTGEITEEQQLYTDGIAEGLRRLPSHRGIVWRGAYLTPELLELYQEGENIVEKAFTSTSYGTNVAENFRGNTKFCIQLKDEGSAGKKVDHFSKHDWEKEVLINAGTQFKVLSKERKTSGLHIIYLQEVET